MGIAAVLALGGLTFAAVRKPAPVADATPIGATVRPPPASTDLPPPPVLAPVQAPEPVPVQRVAVAMPPSPIAAPPPTLRVNTPVLVVDLTAGDKPVAAVDAARAGQAPDKLSANEAFADRLSRTSPETVGIDRLSSLDRVVPQGTVISAVLETAINSDLPGLVRAVVSREVKGFDGSKVLIPRGSRLIGQYSSGLALGQSRAFVIWTRVLRSDGVTVQLNSAATDQLGQAGLGGKVDTHFLRRFGAATLLSVITGAIDYAVNTAGSGQVLVGSTAQANQLASIALQRQIDIQPTIKVAQGTPVRVFVARDLDFETGRKK
ncbi:MAG: type IV secretion system protein VirB10 [Sandarakinorhabdus sp.]|nr:type IV secretion system protein VirB10 [Sandarakinorhabdus sp.]